MKYLTFSICGDLNLSWVYYSDIHNLFVSAGHLSKSFLSFRVSIEKLGIILISLPLHVTLPFPLQLFVFFLYSVCFVFWLLYGNGTFLLVQSIWCSERLSYHQRLILFRMWKFSPVSSESPLKVRKGLINEHGVVKRMAMELTETADPNSWELTDSRMTAEEPVWSLTRFSAFTLELPVWKPTTYYLNNQTFLKILVQIFMCP